MNWYEEPDPHQKGSYVLVLYLPENQLIEIGKLGEYSFVKGIYAYVGSAFGPGGLAARIQHHLRPTNRPHWHIDYLSNIAKPEEVWLSESEIKRKHHWANILQELFASGSEFKGFGASDCRCESHLFWFKNHPVATAFQLALEKELPQDARLKFFSLSQLKSII